MASLAEFAPSPNGNGTSGGTVRSPAMAEDMHRELFRIVAERAFRTGRFTLSSGKQSTRYFNMKPAMMDPRGAELSARALLALVAGFRPDFVSGLEMGAVPVIGAMAAISSAGGRPQKTTFVRKKPKEHGTQALIEGLAPAESLRGANVVVIDDVATSGNSLLVAVEAVRAAGGRVEHAACLVDRQEGAREMLAAHGVALHAVFTADAFPDAP